MKLTIKPIPGLSDPTNSVSGWIRSCWTRMEPIKSLIVKIELDTSIGHPFLLSFKKKSNPTNKVIYWPYPIRCGAKASSKKKILIPNINTMVLIRKAACIFLLLFRINANKMIIPNSIDPNTFCTIRKSPSPETRPLWAEWMANNIAWAKNNGPKNKMESQPVCVFWVVYFQWEWFGIALKTTNWNWRLNEIPGRL